jgi:hypothetical protein
VAAVIQTYDAQGNHRTGTEVDKASAEWLANELRKLGMKCESTECGLRAFRLPKQLSPAKDEMNGNTYLKGRYPFLCPFGLRTNRKHCESANRAETYYIFYYSELSGKS